MKKNHFEHKILTASLFVFIIGLTIYMPRIISSSDYLSALYASVIAKLANNNRAVENIKGLEVDILLTQAAQMKADDMAANGYFSHISPDGKSPWYWMTQAGYKFSYAGENLAIDFSDEKALDDAWMNSLTHRNNVLNKNFTEIGVATSTGIYQGRTTVFVVEMFGSPAQ